MAKDMLINMREAQECRIAIVENGELEELYIERSSNASHVGNIYKGRITNVEPSIQAAFIDFGGPKNGFLHISDVHPQHFPGNKKKNVNEAVGQKRPHRERPPIQECLRRGQEVVVQMTKEGIGTKGPTLTTYLSIPGRLLVMMPGMSRLGVSRKIEDPEDRNKARSVLNDLKLPGDMGFIVRTAGVGHTKRDLQRDLNYLLRLWKSVKQRTKSAKAPAEIYQESNLVIRTIRDVYNNEIKRIICDTPDVAYSVREFLDMAVPRSKQTIKLYRGREGLFHDFDLEQEIEKVYSRRVELRSGGSLIIDQAEALVAIDINSGKFKDHSDAETTALKINQEAAHEILRQLRLRDLGGVVVIDFIDMRHERNRRSVEKIVREGLKKDRAKTKVLKMSSFGIVELTRQRVRPSLKHSMYNECKRCRGMGLIKSEESQALLVLRSLQRATSVDDICRVEVSVTPEVAHHLLNFHRPRLAAMEEEASARIVVQVDPSLAGEEMQIVCKNSRGSEINWEGRSQGSKSKPELLDLREYEKQGKPARKDEPDTDKQDRKSSQDSKEDSGEKDEDPNNKSKKRRRGRRGGRKHKKKNQQDSQDDSESRNSKQEKQQKDSRGDSPEAKTSDKGSDQKDSGDGQSKKKRRRRPRRKKSSDDQKPDESGGEKESAPESQEKEDRKPEPSEPASSNQDADKDSQPEKSKPKGRRTRRKKTSSSAKDASSDDSDKKDAGDKSGSDSNQDDSAGKTAKKTTQKRAGKSASRKRTRKTSKKASGKSDDNGARESQKQAD
jgi:ribonuclease E